jgi:hypothetical protein
MTTEKPTRGDAVSEPNHGGTDHQDDLPDGPIVWFIGFALIALVAVMVIAAQRGSDTEVPTVAEATSEQIAAGQTALAAVGCYAGDIDGKYGSATDQAITDFQSGTGIDVDGIFGPETLAALEGAVAAGTTVCVPTNGGGDNGGDSDSGDGSATDDGAVDGTDDSGTDDSGDDGDGSDGGDPSTQQATLTSESYGPVTFTVTSWDCTGDPGDMALTGAADGGLTIEVTMNDNTGVLTVDGGDEQDGITLNGEMSSLSKEVGGFQSAGTFVEPNFAGEEFDLSGTC